MLERLDLSCFATECACALALFLPYFHLILRFCLASFFGIVVTISSDAFTQSRLLLIGCHGTSAFGLVRQVLRELSSGTTLFFRTGMLLAGFWDYACGTELVLFG